MLFGGINLKLKNRKLKKHLIFFGLGIVIILIISFLLLYVNKTAVPDINYEEYEVSCGEIKQKIQLSGNIKPVQTARIMNVKNSKIAKDFFKEGDWVNQGDTLYILDASEIDKKIRSSKLNISKAEINLVVCEDAVKNCSVRSPVSGMIKELNFSIGDYVTSGNDICTVYSNKKTDATFTLTDDVLLDRISMNDTLIIGNSKNSTELNIVSKDGKYIDVIETTLTDFDNHKTGDICTLKIGDNSFSAHISDIKYDEIPITTSTSGIVESINVKKNSNVNYGDVILKISNAEINANLNQAEIELTEARQELSDLQDELAQYTIKSPIAGTIIKKYANAGYYAATAESETTMMIISDTSSCVVECFVPPKEALKLKEGQETITSSDVLPELNIVGNITKIDCILEESETNSGYRVEITPKEKTEITHFGIDIKAEVTLDKKENVIKIPLEYITHNNTVNVLKNTKPLEYEEVMVE